MIAALYAFLSLIAYAAYAADKQAASRGGARIPEKVLLGLGLAGGWPGALLAQQLHRHKTRKTSFQAAFWLTVATNLFGLYWLLS